MRVNDNTTNLLSFTYKFFNATIHPSSGDLFYSEHHKTFVLVFADSGVDGAFRASYSTSGHVRGPWTAPVTVYNSPLPAGCPKNSWNYDGHAHAGFDPSGASLILSFSSCENYVSMARLHWA
jgi:hypothetical protein